MELLEIKKFKFLQTCLIGATRRAIESPTGGREVRPCSEQRFDSADLSINEHIDELLEYKLIRTSKDIERQREFYDKVRFRISAFEVLGVPREQYAVVFNHVLLRYLPDDLTLMYRQRVKKAAQGLMDESAMNQRRLWQMKELIESLRIQIQIREEGRQGQPQSNATLRSIENAG